MGVGRIVSFESENKGVSVCNSGQKESDITIGMVGFQELKAETIQIRISAKNEKTKSFDNFKLHIPDYQRPYAWGEKQVETLLNDLKDVIESDKKSYLLGSLILHKEEQEQNGKRQKYLNIVDGQQRLVTLALICAELGQWSKDEKNWVRVPQNIGTNDSFFLSDQKFEHSESQRNLKNNFAYIRKWFDRNQKEVVKFQGLLESDKIEFVCIVTPNLDDAFIFFDSANSRGKKLEDYDLIKAYHLRKIKGLGNIKKYTQMFENLAKNGEDFERLFRWVLAPSRRWIMGEQINATNISIYDEFCREIPRKIMQDKNLRSQGILDFTHGFLGGEDFFEYLNKFSCFIKQMQEKAPYLKIPNKDTTFFYVGYLYLSVLCLCYAKFQDYKLIEKNSSRILRIVASMRIQVLRLTEARMRDWGCKILPKIFWITHKYDFYLILEELDGICREEEENKNDGKNYKETIEDITGGTNEQ